jgi:hypothetical protein
MFGQNWSREGVGVLSARVMHSVGVWDSWDYMIPVLSLPVYRVYTLNRRILFNLTSQCICNVGQSSIASWQNEVRTHIGLLALDIDSQPLVADCKYQFSAGQKEQEARRDV